MKRTSAVKRPAIHALTPKITKHNAQTTRTSVERPMCAAKGSASSTSRAVPPHQTYSSKPPSQARGATRCETDYSDRDSCGANEAGGRTTHFALTNQANRRGADGPLPASSPLEQEVRPSDATPLWLRN